MEILRDVQGVLILAIIAVLLLWIPAGINVRNIGLDYIDQITKNMRLRYRLQPPNVYLDQSCKGKYLVCSMNDCTFLFHIEKLWNHGNDMFGAMLCICIEGSRETTNTLRIWKHGVISAMACPKARFLDKYNNRLIHIVDIADISPKTFLVRSNRAKRYPVPVITTGTDDSTYAIITNSFKEAKDLMWEYECKRTNRPRSDYSGNLYVSTERKELCWIHNFVN